MPLNPQKNRQKRNKETHPKKEIVQLTFQISIKT